MPNTVQDIAPSVLRAQHAYRTAHCREPDGVVLSDEDWRTVYAESRKGSTGGGQSTTVCPQCHHVDDDHRADCPDLPMTGTLFGMTASGSTDVQAGTFLLGGQPHKIYTGGQPHA